MQQNPYIQNQQDPQTLQDSQNLNAQVPPQDLGINQTNPYYTTQEPSSLLGTFDTQKFLIGAAIGAVGVYLLTNEKAQKALFKSVAKGALMFSAGLEEMKERYEDAQAELEAEK
jgi:hypothetical protein